MSPENCNGYVLSEEIRTLHCFGVPIALVLLAGFAILLWVETVVHMDNIIPYVIFSSLWTLLILYITLIQYRAFRIAELRYSCTDKEVTNNYAGEMHKLMLNEPVFLTQITCKFAMGKAIREEKFYIMSMKPLSEPIIAEPRGILAIKKIWNQGILIVPQTIDTNEWIAHSYGTREIPQYPKVSYHP